MSADGSRRMLPSTQPATGLDDRKEQTLSPLHLETLTRDRIAERDRTLAGWAIARTAQPTPPATPAPLPPLRRGPRLRSPRAIGGLLVAALARVRVLLAGAAA